QFPVPALTSHPQIQGLVLLVQGMPVDLVPGPLEDSRELVIARQSPSVHAARISKNCRQPALSTNSCSEPKIQRTDRYFIQLSGVSHRHRIPGCTLPAPV